MKRLMTRIICVLVIVFAASIAAQPASAAPAMCQICLGDNYCPGDLTPYDVLCQGQCGSGTYAGACREGPDNDCGNGLPPGHMGRVAIVCYEPM